ncbi:hypothetical protein ACN47E_003668 [Coniothyrium glycines]
MVGVPKSTGCLLCRKRKIKCDETWPLCLNCRKNSKSCPGPPARHTFRELGPRLNSGNAKPVHSSTKPPKAHHNRRLTQLREKYAENGSVVHKFRISQGHDWPGQLIHRSNTASLRLPSLPFLRRPSPSQHHELACALIAATTTGSKGHRMSVFGPLIHEIPQRIGHNPALDAAVAVLVNVHASLVYKKNASDFVSPELYLRAIKTLQQCLEDPHQGMSTNTVCASVLLGLVEAFAGPRQGNRYLAHAGGAGRLIELQSPEKYQTAFTKEILRFARGGIIINSIYERKCCFLASPQWHEIAFDKTGLDHDDRLHTDLMQCMAELPEIFQDVKKLCEKHTINLSVDDKTDYGPDGPFFDDDTLLESPTPTHGAFTLLGDSHNTNTPHLPAFSYSTSNAVQRTLTRAQDLKLALRTLGKRLSAKLADGITASEAPAKEQGSPIHTTYQFSNWRDMTAYNCFWSVLILTNKILLKLLHPCDLMRYGLQIECRGMALEICKTWEGAWASKPIGAFHTGLSFVVAYEFCNPYVQGWIVKSLNSLLDFQGVDTFRWSDEVIVMLSANLSGGGPDVCFSHTNLSEAVG